MAGANGSGFDESPDGDDGLSGLASVVQVDRGEDVAAICGRIDTAPTFAVVVHAPGGNRQLGTELGMRRLQRHAEDSGKVIAIATGAGTLANRARQIGIPVARRPDHVRWDAGGRATARVVGRTLIVPAAGRYVRAVVALATAGLLLAAALTVAPSASIVAFPPVEEVAKTVTITASPDRDRVDLATLTVPARKVSAEQTITLAVRTTGKAPVATGQARMALAVTNSATSDRLVAAGAQLLAGPESVAFEVASEAVVPAGRTATLNAIAREPGAKGNVPAGTALRWKDATYEPLSVTNPAAASGGQTEERPAVDANDIVAINGLAGDLGLSETIRRIVLTARPQDAVLLGTAETAIEPGELSAVAGAPADMLTLEVKVTVTAFAVLAGALEDIARQVLVAEHARGEFIPGSVTAVETGARQLNPKDGTITTDIEVRGRFARDITRTSLRNAVKGGSRASAKSTLARRYGIDDAEVDVSPDWAPRLPRFGFRISVELRSRPLSGATQSEGAPRDVPVRPTPSRAGTPASRP